MDIITGHLIYNRGYEFLPDEKISIGYLNQWLETPVTNLGDSGIRILLRKCGIAENDIVHAYASVDISKSIVEIFFAYRTLTKPPKERIDLYLVNKHHKYGSYAAYQGLLIPWFSVINKDWKAIGVELAKLYKITSFMIRPVSVPELPDLIIKKKPNPGVLADMRNIPESYKHVKTFKDLNFNIIWYMDEAGKQKTIRRPAGGWK